MKKNYITLLFLLLATIGFTQNNDFNNNGGDFLWSNTSNWSLNSLPTSSNTVRLTKLLESLVNQDFTVKKIQTTSAVGSSSSADNKETVVAGAGILTIDATTNNGIGIQNNSANNVDLAFNGNIIINNMASGFTKMNNANGATNSITFKEASILTLTTGLDTAIGSGGDNFNFNGTIKGSANLRFTGITSTTFGSTSSNPEYTGQLVFTGGSEVIVNTADNNVFYNGEKIQVNANNASIEINGENVFGGGISIGGTNSFDFSVTKNQSSMTTIIFTGAGNLNLVVDSSITNLSFANSAESQWETGSTLNITGYKEGVIRFGTDNTGLTSDQLDKIVVDGTSDAVALNEQGYLINKTSLSVSDSHIVKKHIAYPTLTSNKIFFSQSQDNVKILDLNGKVLKHNTTKNQKEISLEFLSSGLYLIVFDDKIVEKFIKK